MGVASSDLDLYSPESLLEPYEGYRRLRDLGPAVWLERLGMYVIARYDGVHAALGDAESFISSAGVSMNEDLNKQLGGTLLNSDAERHERLRRVIERPLLPAEVMRLQTRIRDEAEALVDRLVSQRTFDAATELAEHLPVTIVSDLVGLPDEGRERMLVWSKAQGNCFSPPDERTAQAQPIIAEYLQYAFTQCVPGKLKPGGWADMIWQAADRGEITREEAPHLMNDYVGPSLDTTISATANMIWLFTQFPEQWARLREQPKLIPLAISESVRLESPIQGFSRILSRDYDLDGAQLPKGARAIVLYGSANRDERFWDHAETFDIGRDKTNEHMGFGFGEHRCVGMNLARLEMSALLTALLKRVERFELKEMQRGVNSVLRVVDRCVVTVH